MATKEKLVFCVSVHILGFIYTSSRDNNYVGIQPEEDLVSNAVLGKCSLFLNT